MKHSISKRFRQLLKELPDPIQHLATKNLAVVKNASDPSLQAKKLGPFYSVRIGFGHRAFGVESPDGVVWFWIGCHAADPIQTS